MSTWQDAIDAADRVRRRHRLGASATRTTWLDGRVGGTLGVLVTLPDGREVTGTPRQIGRRVADALALKAPAGEALPAVSPARQNGKGSTP